MKQILIILATLTFTSAHLFAAAPQNFSGVRAEVTNQMAMTTNAPDVDKKLVTTLRKALSLIDKAKGDLVSDTKTLAMLTGTLNKSSISNEFDASLQAAVDLYLNDLAGQGATLSNRLAATFSSGPRNAAQNNLNQMFAALDTVNATENSGLAAKALALAAKKGVVTSKLVAKAENANPPQSAMTASITGAINSNFRADGAGATFQGVNHYRVIGAWVGGGIPPEQRTIELGLLNAVPGTSTIALTGTSAFKILNFGGLANYVATGGTATVTVNTAAEAVFGTFTFTANGPAGAISVTGEFFALY